MSSRLNFEHETEFSDNVLFRCKTEAHELPFREKSELKILFIVHGYRGIFENVLKKYEQFESYLDNSYDIVVEYYWPGSWEATIGFVAAYNRSKQSGIMFGKGTTTFLKNIIDMCPKLENLTVDIFGHSLGCLVSSYFLHNYDESFDSVLSKIKSMTLVHASPAMNLKNVNNDYVKMFFDRLDKYVLLFSEKDKVLKYFYRLIPENWFRKAIPLVVRDIMKNPNKNKIQDLEWFLGKTIYVDLTDKVNSHGDYWRLPEIAQYLI